MKLDYACILETLEYVEANSNGFTGEELIFRVD